MDASNVITSPVICEFRSSVSTSPIMSCSEVACACRPADSSVRSPSAVRSSSMASTSSPAVVAIRTTVASPCSVTRSAGRVGLAELCHGLGGCLVRGQCVGQHPGLPEPGDQTIGTGPALEGAHVGHLAQPFLEGREGLQGVGADHVALDEDRSGLVHAATELLVDDLDGLERPGVRARPRPGRRRPTGPSGRARHRTAR